MEVVYVPVGHSVHVAVLPAVEKEPSAQTEHVGVPDHVHVRLLLTPPTAWSETVTGAPEKPATQTYVKELTPACGVGEMAFAYDGNVKVGQLTEKDID